MAELVRTAAVTGVSAAERASRVLPTLRQHVAAVDRDARFPTENLAALRDSGLLGMFVPAEHGGIGTDVADYAAAAITLAAGCTSTAMIWAMHCQQVDALARFADPHLRSSLLPRIAAGQVYIASVTTEPGKGGHLLTARDALTGTTGGSWVLDRRAPIVTGGDFADGFLVTMRDGPDLPPSQVTLLYADRKQLIVKADGTAWNPLGMRATHSVGLHLHGVVPDTQVVGQPGRFRDVALDSFVPLGHIGWSACWIGAARYAYETVVRLYGKNGSPAGFDIDSDLFASRLGRIRMDLEVAHGYLMRVVSEISQRRSRNEPVDANETQIHLNTLKVVAAERAFAVVDQLIDLAGLNLGYRKDSVLPLERLFRDLRSASLNHSNERLLVATGRLSVLDRAVRLG